MVYDTVVAIQKVVVDQEQINRERDENMNKQIGKLIYETQNIQQEIQYTRQDQNQREAQNIFRILENQDDRWKELNQLNQEVIRKLGENQKESKKLEEQIEEIAKLADAQHREIFKEVKMIRMENQEQ
jgi:predicted P-loop ATPase/GTPase